MYEGVSIFRGLSIDTLLGCISCVLGIIALCLGTKAYRSCRIIKSALNDNKEYSGNSSDYSQRAAGNIVNNYCDAKALVQLTEANFEKSLKRICSVFEHNEKANLEQIIEKTKDIIHEQKLDLSGITKLDWINMYFENAKRTSDDYMQKIWAKILARELSKPDSISYKALDILKDMSVREFKTFEKLCSLEIDGWIFEDNMYNKYGLEYLDLVKLSEYGLLNMMQSQRTLTILPHKNSQEVYKSYLVLLNNPTDKTLEIKHTAYILTMAARELCQVADITVSEEYAIECAHTFSNLNGEVRVSLHRIINRCGDVINYKNEDLLSK